MSKKESKILTLWNKGHNIKTIAKRVGYEGNALTAGIEVVRKVLTGNGFKV